MSAEIINFDVRPDFRSGQHPREKIQNALGQLTAGESLRLLVPFEPVPLLHWAKSQGFTYKTSAIADGDWEVFFTRGAKNGHQPTATAVVNAGATVSSPAQIIDLDARALEPPQPLMRILEAVTRLPQGATLRARTDRRPIHLYSPLQERGFVGQSEEQSDGSFLTHIQHA